MKKLTCFSSLVLLLASCGGDPNRGKSGHGLFALGEIVGLDPFDENVLSTYELTIDPADWAAIVNNPKDQSTWRSCTVNWQGEVYEDVAIRPSGHQSAVSGAPKPSFRLKFNYFVPHRKFHSIYISGVKLMGDTEDPSMMRQRIETGVYRSLGIPASRCVHAKLFVNGAYTGLYEVEERMKRGFIKEHFGRDGMNQLYDWGPVIHPNDVFWMGMDPVMRYVTNYFSPILRKLDPLDPMAKVPFPEVIREFVRTVNLDPWPQMASEVDVDMFYRFMAGEVLTGEGDSYVSFVNADPSNGYRSANFRVYKNQNNNRFIVLPWDKDQGYWTPRDSVTMGFDQRIMTRQIILANPDALAAYLQILGDAARGVASLDAMNARIDFILNQVIDAAFQDNLKSAGSNLNWLAHVTTIRNYIAQHNAMIVSQTP